MSNPKLQTSKQPAPQSSAQQRRRPKAAPRAVAFRKQTARLEGRRDGTPLIFGWGRHLTRAQKSQIQRAGAYSFFGLVAIAVLGVFVFGLLDQYVLIPNATIVKINDVAVSQETYRKALAYNAQDLWNTLQKHIKTHDDLTAKAQGGDTSSDQALQIVTQQLQSEESKFAQAQITQQTIDQIVRDQLIQQAIPRIAKQDPNAAKQLQATGDAISGRLNDFKKAFPSGETYADFLKKNSMSDDDLRSAIAMQVRSDLMQTYLAGLLKSPALQIHLRHIETSTADDARKVTDELTKQKLTSKGANWSDLAKKYSLDTDTKDIGGDMGWVSWGGATGSANDATMELWALGEPWTTKSPHAVGDYATIATVNGTFDVVQILEIDPSRAVNEATLQSNKGNARDHWVDGQKKINQISTPDADAEQADRNLPKTPNVNAQLPNYSPQAPTGIGG